MQCMQNAARQTKRVSAERCPNSGGSTEWTQLRASESPFAPGLRGGVRSPLFSSGWSCAIFVCVPTPLPSQEKRSASSHSWRSAVLRPRATRSARAASESAFVLPKDPQRARVWVAGKRKPAALSQSFCDRSLLSIFLIAVQRRLIPPRLLGSGGAAARVASLRRPRRSPASRFAAQPIARTASPAGALVRGFRLDGGRQRRLRLLRRSLGSGGGVPHV